MFGFIYYLRSSAARQLSSNRTSPASLKARLFFEFLSFVFLLLALLPAISHATPQIIRVDGSIFDNTGVPVTASKDIQIKAYDAASGGSLLWTSSVYNTVVSTGKFTINLDAAAGSPSLVDRFGERTANQAIYFQIEVDSGAANGSMDTPTIVLPRMRARGTAFALAANTADALKGVTATTEEMNYLAGISANVQTQINAVNGTASGVSAKVSKAGDSMSGALQVGANITSTGTVQAATLNSTAATASRFALFDSSKNLASSASTVTDTEFGYLSGITANLATNLNGLTSNVQTQINGKQATLAYVPVSKLGDSMSGALQVGAAITSTGTLTAATLNATGLTGSRALISDSSKNIGVSATTDTELGYLAGVTSSVSAKLNKFSATEAGYLSGVTANIQTQIRSINIGSVGRNYFGSGADGSATIAGVTVVGDATDDNSFVTMNYTTLTINSGATLTTQARKRALLVYVSGDCVINGTLSMGKGASATASQIDLWKYGSNSTQTFSSESTNQSFTGNMTGYSTPAAGAAGGSAAWASLRAGTAGSAGAGGQTGGGGEGAGSNVTGTNPGNGGAGAAGTAYSGGAGGGAGGYNQTGAVANAGQAGASSGGKGGDAGANVGNNRGSAAGAGNPAGTGSSAGTGGFGAPGTGTGGTLILLVGGNLTIGASGVVSANGSAGGAATASGTSIAASGGGSGGGRVIVLYAGTLSNSGTVQANGGSGGVSSGGTSALYNGGAGGAGSVSGPTQIAGP